MPSDLISMHEEKNEINNTLAYMGNVGLQSQVATGARTIIVSSGQTAIFVQGLSHFQYKRPTPYTKIDNAPSCTKIVVWPCETIIIILKLIMLIYSYSA